MIFFSNNRAKELLKNPPGNPPGFMKTSDKVYTPKIVNE
jgi:hypothetical protein